MVSGQQLKIVAGLSSLPLSIALAFTIVIKPAAANPTEPTNSSRQRIESPLILQDEYKPPVTGTPTNDGGSGSRT